MDNDMVQSQLEYLQEQLNSLNKQVGELQRKLDKLDISKLPWDEAPSWARWAAMDQDRCWWWYEDEPTVRTSTWGTVASGHHCESFDAPPCDDWTESKQARP